MKNRIVVISTLVLIFILLVSVSNVIAENVYLTEEEIQRIGVDKVRLESPIGVVILNLSKGELSADGYFSVSNTWDEELYLKCSVITQLSTADLNETGRPRIHPKISNFIVFYPMPNSNWVKLEEVFATVEPNSMYNFRFSVSIPEEYVLNYDKGYLVYINVGKDLGEVSGANIGINYNYKLFIIFTGDIAKSSLVDNILFTTFLLLLLLLTLFIVLIYLAKKRLNTKSDNIPEQDSRVYFDGTEDNDDDKVVHTNVDFLLNHQFKEEQ